MSCLLFLSVGRSDDWSAFRPLSTFFSCFALTTLALTTSLYNSPPLHIQKTPPPSQPLVDIFLNILMYVPYTVLAEKVLPSWWNVKHPVWCYQSIKPGEGVDKYALFAPFYKHSKPVSAFCFVLSEFFEDFGDVITCDVPVGATNTRRRLVSLES